MQFNNFLADIYFGHFNKDIFHEFKDSKDDDRTRNFIEHYLEISQQYPPRQLEADGRVSSELLEKLKTIGFFGLNIPSTYGGAGLSLRRYLKVVEVVATQSLALGFTSLAHLSIGVKGIALFGNEQQKQKYLPKAASGEMIISYALTEPKRGSDAKHIESTATLSDDGEYYILNGSKAYITNANYAQAMTVFAQMDPQKPGFMGAFIVETGWEGVKIGKDIPKMGLKASSTAAVHFKDVRVPKQNLLGSPGDGFKVAMTILNYGRLALGAASVGILNQAVEDMLKRSKNRFQFGRPIQNYELIQEKIVTARVNASVVSTITAFTAAMLEENPLAPVAIESSHCKLFGTTRAWNALYDAQQVAGGSGYLTTQPYEMRMRDFRVTTIFEGTTEIHSIYPALFVIRALTKQIQKAYPGKIAQFRQLLKMLFRRSNWKMRFRHRRMNHAIRMARSLARRIRFLILVGLMIYGRKITEKQFYLRRITFLSFYLYGLLTLTARLSSKQKDGSDLSEDMDILAYFMEEARSYQRHNGTIHGSIRERLHKRVFRHFSST
ncbi:MAG: acyl-CoA dehydrogenase family protein [Desulfobacterales bacterium]